MMDGGSVIRLRTLVIFHDERNATVTIQPRTPGLPPWQRSVEDLEQVLLPLIDPKAAKASLAEPHPAPF